MIGPAGNRRRAARAVLLLAAVLALFGLTLYGAPARAQMVVSVAAVVNDSVITQMDLADRVKLAVVSAGLPDTPELRKRLTPQVLRNMIDEKLELEAAKRDKITVPDKDIEAAIGRIEKDNHLPPGGLEKVLRQDGIPVEVLKGQIRAALSWAQVVNTQLRPMVKVGPDEVDQALARLKANAGKPENLLAEIFLSVDSPAQDRPVREAAERIIEQLRQGANFAALARQFSQSSTAASGGDLGWVREGELPEELDRVVAQMPPGSLSAPIRTPNGYYILLLRDRRTPGQKGTVRLHLRQLFLPIPPNAPPSLAATTTQRVEMVGAQAKSCADMDTLAKRIGSPAPSDVGEVAVTDLPADLRKVLLDLPLDKVSPAVRTPQGVMVLMVCGKTEPKSTLPTRDEVEQGLVRQRLELMARRMLRDMRRQAFVDIRL